MRAARIPGSTWFHGNNTANFRYSGANGATFDRPRKSRTMRPLMVGPFRQMPSVGVRATESAVSGPSTSRPIACVGDIIIDLITQLSY